MKKYHDIVRYGHSSTRDVLQKGDDIVIQEKIDGSNASFKREGNKVLAFSQNSQLDESNNLGGFYQWVQDKIKASDLTPNVIYFGEWTNPHKIKYSPEFTKTFFLFDLFHELTDSCLGESVVEREAEKLDLKLVPTFYKGKYQSFEHLMSFVGHTEIDGQLGGVSMGEGIVVKNIEYKDKYGQQMFVKLVIDKFAEVQKQKTPRDPNQPLSLEAHWVKDNMAKPRVEKMLFKLVDEGVLKEDYSIEDMKTILSNINKRLIEDLFKEESETLPQDYDSKEIGKSVARFSPLIIKEILRESGRM